MYIYIQGIKGIIKKLYWYMCKYTLYNDYK